MFSTNNNIETENEEHYTAYGECRCCLAKGQHRDVTKEYYYKNRKEVYKDIFLHCFNFSLSTHIGISCLICDGCVQRLRDANSFRMMVSANEAQLLASIIFKSAPDADEFVSVPGPHKTTVDVKINNESDNPDADYRNELKENHTILRNLLETSRNDDHLQMADNNNDDDDSTQHELVIDEDVEYDDEKDIYCSSVTRIPSNGKDDEPWKIIDGVTNQFPRILSPVQPKQTELEKVCPQNYGNLKKPEDDTVKPKPGLLIDRPGLEKDTVTVMTNKQLLARNASTIFEWSNACAFKPKMKNGYSCYYCPEICKPDTLREHQETHDKSTLYNILRRHDIDKLVIYADITDLKCTICKKDISNLIDLREHLSMEHSKKIYASPNRVIPFKLQGSEFDCQICGEKFETFGMVERHMNLHYASFFCEICGSGFITKNRLAIHNYSAHRDENITCELCDKSFRTRKIYRLHYDVVHQQLKKYACPKCPEKFLNYFARCRHMVQVHDEEPVLYKCNFCGTSFDRKASLVSHERRCLLKPKFFKCGLCAYTCLTRAQLNDHMIQHGETSPNHQFKCPVCRKLYVSNRTLMMHLRKYHKDFE